MVLIYNDDLMKMDILSLKKCIIIKHHYHNLNISSDIYSPIHFT